MIWKQAISNLSGWSPVDSMVGVVLSGCIMLALATIAVNMLLLLISGWILMYAGIFFLGFGGSRWTSDMAINYFKTVLGLAVQLLVMILLAVPVPVIVWLILARYFASRADKALVKA